MLGDAKGRGVNIRNHRLAGDGIHHVESPNQGGPFAAGRPDTLVIHYTAGSTARSAIDTLCDRSRRVSAHLVVGRDGSVTQLVPFDTVAWHAGQSEWKGRTGLNHYSIGIEIDNAGQLEVRNGQCVSWFGQVYPPEEVVWGVHGNQQESTPWHRFPYEQVRVVEELCLLLIGEYGIGEIVGHDEIAPQRKIDPGPAFPLDELRQRLLAPPTAPTAPRPRRPREESAMKITAVKPILVNAGRNYTFVKVETDAGTYGLGEAGLGRRARALEETMRAMEPDLVGEDPFRIEHLWQVLYRGGFFPGGVVQSAAVSALDMALWDIKGKALGVPVFELLGGRTRDRVACYPHVGEREDVDRLVAECRKKVEEGWKYVRWGLCDPAGPDLLEPARAVRFGIDQVRAVRQALPEVEICVDVHTRLDPPAAVQFCKGVEECRPYFIEDPLRSENPASLGLLRQQTSVPIAVGEQFAGKWSFRECIEQDLMDYCRMDLCIVGGITEAKKIAGWCEAHYIHLAPHNPLGPVCTAASLHLCLASSLVGVMELARVPGTILPEVFPVQAPFADGHLLVPEAPGLGVELDEAAAAQRPYQETGGRGVGYRRDDGSYANW